MKQLEKISVLIVDDYEINIQVLKLILSQLQINPDIATNGIEALEKFKQKPYNLIFMDLMMPEMDGYSATNAIRLFEKENNLQKSIIIALSASYDINSSDYLLNHGFNDTLEKPILFNNLKDITAKYFSK